MPCVARRAAGQPTVEHYHRHRNARIKTGEDVLGCWLMINSAASFFGCIGDGSGRVGDGSGVGGCDGCDGGGVVTASSSCMMTVVTKMVVLTNQGEMFVNTEAADLLGTVVVVDGHRSVARRLHARLRVDVQPALQALEHLPVKVHSPAVSAIHHHPRFKNGHQIHDPSST
eukprot:3257120-Rhodomonas_salina.2